ncbi:MAG: MiaB/RimO family radical SAM methylthiotransferase, partial [Chitinophagaceae bacterium]
EVEVLAAQGVLEVTLLGQNVNSYGRSFGDRDAFGKLLRAVGAVDGIERVRFTSPHPRDFTDDVISAMAETPAVCPSLHMPLQSGSDAVLKAMRRSYRSERFLGILARVREQIPDAAITTDVIVGFPGETDADFEDTLRVVEASRFAGAFTFQYSQRPGTPAADLPPLPKEVVQERYERLVELQDRISYEGMQSQVGRTVEVLVSSGEGRKDTGDRLTGRARDNRLVHLAGAAGVRPGDVVETVVTRAGPHYLVADGALLSHRRTAAGDATEAGRTPSTPGVSLGMPSIGLPAPLPAAPACG